MATDNLRQLEALLGRLDRDRAANQHPADHSSRTPNTISTQFNAADQIERQLRADGHRLWGFVVYRCSYGSDAEWEQCVERMRASLRKAMNLYNGHDLLEDRHFALTVIADGSRLDGASTRVVREHFEHWCARMMHKEQGSEEEVEARREEASPFDSRLPLRYRFCIQIDDASLQSILSDEGKGWVKLVKRDWQPSEVSAQQQQRDQQPAALPGSGMEDEGDYTDDEDEEAFPAIEGCTDQDVGWMKVQLASVMPDMYVSLRDSSAWHTQYLRPPEIATA